MGRTAAIMRAAAVSLMLVSLGGCSGLSLFGNDKIVEEEIIPAETLYQEAVDQLDKGNAESGLAAIEKLQRQHPYSEYAEKTRVLEIYAQFGAKRYDEAILAADRYLALYPNSEDTAYVLYMQGTAYFNKISDITRNQQNAQDAIATYERLVDNYPNSEYAEVARRNLLIARDQLAGKEMSVGRYYLGNGQYTAAINRFLTVVRQHERSTHVEEALMRLTEAYLKLGLVREAQNAAAVLGHNYPSGQWYQDAYALLQAQGLVPTGSAPIGNLRSS